MLELLAPVRFSHWDADGRPVGKPVVDAWITVAAVSKTQTQNTMRLFSGMIPKATRRQFGITIGKEQVVAMDGQRQILAVTSSPETLEGNRPTFQVGNEPHHWKENNNGLDMRDVMVRNAAKIPGGQSRICWITNAYNDAEGSVAQMNRESYEDTLDGKNVNTGVLYDSLEAPPEARLNRREIPVVLEAVRGDAVWLDIETLTLTMLDSNNSASQSRRFYYNQVGASEEAWLDFRIARATVHPQVKQWRADPDIEQDALRLGWAIVDPKDEVVMFFDGGKKDDHTALSGCRLSDGYTFGIGFWGRPSTLHPTIPWWAPRDAVDERVIEAMKRFRVVAFWGDPSHVPEDEEDKPYWLDMMNAWHRRYKDKMQFWAVKNSERQHAVIFDMTSPSNLAVFVPAAQKFVQDAVDAVEGRKVAFSHCGHPQWMRYLRNARDYPTKWGTSLWKGSRGSKNKIDGAVTHVGARMMRDLILNKGVERQGSRVWGSWGSS